MYACYTLKKSYHWVTSPFLLIALCNLLGTKDINCWSLVSGIFAHSWCIQDLTCSTVNGHHCLILLFMMRHTFSIGDRSGLLARFFNLCRMRPGKSHCLVSHWSLLINGTMRQWTKAINSCVYVHHGSMTVSQTILPEGAMVTHILLCSG